MMQRYKRIILWFVSGFGALIALAVAIVLLSDTLVNQDFVKQKIKDEFIKVAGGQVDYQRIRISFFPYPHLVVYQGNFSANLVVVDLISGGSLEWYGFSTTGITGQTAIITFDNKAIVLFLNKAFAVVHSASGGN